MFGYSWLRTSQNAPLVHAIIDGCNAFGIDVEGMHTETGPGVYEAAIRYDDLEKAADKAALFKTVVEGDLRAPRPTACFMAKPNAEAAGLLGPRAPVALGRWGGKNALPRRRTRQAA